MGRVEERAGEVALFEEDLRRRRDGMWSGEGCLPLQGLLMFGITRMWPCAWFTRHVRLPASERQGCSALFCSSLLNLIHTFTQIFSEVCNNTNFLSAVESSKIANANAPVASN